jgi:hypothetical protein
MMQEGIVLGHIISYSRLFSLWTCLTIVSTDRSTPRRHTLWLHRPPRTGVWLACSGQISSPFVTPAPLASVFVVGFSFYIYVIIFVFMRLYLLFVGLSLLCFLWFTLLWSLLHPKSVIP